MRTEIIKNANQMYGLLVIPSTDMYLLSSNGVSDFFVICLENTICLLDVMVEKVLYVGQFENKTFLYSLCVCEMCREPPCMFASLFPVSLERNTFWRKDPQIQSEPSHYTHP